MQFVRQNILPVIAAFFWGTTFVAQSAGSEYLGTFTYNFARSVVGVIFLIAVIAAIRIYRRKKGLPQSYETYGSDRKSYYRKLLISGFVCGSCLTVAANLQQAGIALSGAGKSGFLTALYVVLVPALGIAVKKKAPKNVWIAVVIAVAALYFLCVTPGSLGFAAGDILLLLCALSFAVQILVIDKYSALVDPIELSCTQFIVLAAESGILSLIFETSQLSDYRHAIWAILYAGIFSSGVAYTLQILSQKDSNPTVVSLLMSLESVFAVVSGAIILHEQLTGREYFGCILMFAAVIIAQIPARSKSDAEE